MLRMVKSGRRKRRKKNAQLTAGEEEDLLLPDPTWCDIQPIGHDPLQAIRFPVAVPEMTRFANQMMSLREFWAQHVSWQTAHTIATAIAHQCVAWHEDWHHWRIAAQQFFNNLCTHRRITDGKRDFAIGELRDQINKMDDELKQIKSSMVTMQNAISNGPKVMDIEVDISKAVDDILRHREEKLRGLSRAEAEMRAIGARSPHADSDSRIHHAIEKLRGRAVSPAPTTTRVVARSHSPFRI